MNQRQVPISQLRLSVSDEIDNLKAQVMGGYQQWEQKAKAYSLAAEFIKSKNLFDEFKKYVETIQKGEIVMPKQKNTKPKANPKAIKKARQKTRTQKKR